MIRTWRLASLYFIEVTFVNDDISISIEFKPYEQAQKLGKDASENQNILDKIRLGSLQIKK